MAVDVIAGVDEAGRGPLAGPVVAAAVVFDRTNIPAGINDSKKLSARKREALAATICESAEAWFVAAVDASEIDARNILNATMYAMQQAVAGLHVVPTTIRVDGNRAPDFSCCAPDAVIETIIGGDGLDLSIGAASILAKTHRDAMMIDYDRQWPVYGFAKHKGYPTAAHLQALTSHGPCDIHRRSFKPVRDVLPVAGA